MEKHEQEFHLEEFKQLKMEIATLLSRISILFRYSIIFSALIYSWLLTEATGISTSGPCLALPLNLSTYALYIPPTFVFLSGVIAFLTYGHIGIIGSYIRIAEKALGSSQLGFEEYWKKIGPKLTVGVGVTWAIMFSGCILGSLKIHDTFSTLTFCTK